MDKITVQLLDLALDLSLKQLSYWANHIQELQREMPEHIPDVLYAPLERIKYWSEQIQDTLQKILIELRR